LEPTEFADMVYRIRNVEAAMGDDQKKIEEGEKRLLWRKT
jgi:sialic acid synthase SpsE